MLARPAMPIQFLWLSTTTTPGMLCPLFRRRALLNSCWQPLRSPPQSNFSMHLITQALYARTIEAQSPAASVAEAQRGKDCLRSRPHGTGGHSGWSSTASSASIIGVSSPTMPKPAECNLLQRHPLANPCYTQLSLGSLRRALHRSRSSPQGDRNRRGLSPLEKPGTNGARWLFHRLPELDWEYTGHRSPKIRIRVIVRVPQSINLAGRWAWRKWPNAWCQDQRELRCLKWHS